MPSPGKHLLSFLAELLQQRHQLLLFHLAQHAVEIEVVELQVEVGGDESRELMVVVLLVDMEQLLVLGGHDGKAVVAQVVPQPLVGLLQQGRVHDIGDIHLVVLVARLEIQLAQLVLALSDTVHKGALLVGISDDFRLDAVIVFLAVRQFLVALAAPVATVLVVVVLVLAEGPHQGVVPRR